MATERRLGTGWQPIPEGGCHPLSGRQTGLPEQALERPGRPGASAGSRGCPAPGHEGPSSCRERPDSDGAPIDAQALPQFLTRGIRLLLDHPLEPLGRRGPARVVAPLMRLGLDRAGPTLELQEPDGEGEADDEAVGDLADRALLSLHGIDYALSEVLSLGGHGPPPLLNPPNRTRRNRSAPYPRVGASRHRRLPARILLGPSDRQPSQPRRPTVPPDRPPALGGARVKEPPVTRSRYFHSGLVLSASLRPPV